MEKDTAIGVLVSGGGGGEGYFSFFLYIVNNYLVCKLVLKRQYTAQMIFKIRICICLILCLLSVFIIFFLLFTLTSVLY